MQIAQWKSADRSRCDFLQTFLHDGRASFPLKKVGLVYEHLDFPVQLTGAKHVDFWACDALNLSFSKETFGFVSALNVFDIVNSPRDLLLSIQRMLKNQCHAVLATPYDWSSSTPGENADVIQNLQLAGEVDNHPWHIRVHNWHTAIYNTHIFAAKKTEV